MKLAAIIFAVFAVVAFVALIHAVIDADKHSKKERNKHERATDD